MDELEAVLEDPVSLLDDPRPELRRLALSALAGRSDHAPHAIRLLQDADPRVRAEAAEVLGSHGAVAFDPLLAAARDSEEEIVLEAIAAALGELEDPRAVPWLVSVATGSHQTLTRETAVASLGAIGAPVALPVLLALLRGGPPQVRRRCVVALTAFDGPEAEAAILAARGDRNPMVREAAEMIVGRE